MVGCEKEIRAYLSCQLGAGGAQSSRGRDAPQVRGSNGGLGVCATQPSD